MLLQVSQKTSRKAVWCIIVIKIVPENLWMIWEFRQAIWRHCLQTFHSPFKCNQGINTLAFIVIIIIMHFSKPSTVNTICLICCIIHSHKVLFIIHSNFVPFLLFVCFNDPLTAICVGFLFWPTPIYLQFSFSFTVFALTLAPSLTDSHFNCSVLSSGLREIFRV